MSFFSGALNYIAGNDRSGATSPVRRLVERIRNSSLPADRRKSIKDLNKAVKEGPHRQKEIGRDGLRVVFAVLEQDRAMPDTLEAALELLISLCGSLDPPSSNDYGTGDESSWDPEEFASLTANAAEENTKLYAGIPNGVSLLTDLLEEEEFYIRFNAVELLSAMVGSVPELLTSSILASPMGVSRLVDLLSDTRDVIRNDGLLLLIALCQNSEELAKILTFENIFEKLFTIIGSVVPPSERKEDGEIDTKENAILVHDCLQLIQTILMQSGSNQAFFREANCITKLVTLLVFPGRRADRYIVQDFENLQIAIAIVETLCRGSTVDSMANCTACTEAGVVEKLYSFAFEMGSNQRQLEVTALSCLSQVIEQNPQGVSRLKSSFNGSPFTAIFSNMCSSQSSTVRYSSFQLLWQLLTDAKGATSSACLHGLINVSANQEKNEEEKDLEEIAVKIKEVAGGWPREGIDAASVFYCCILVSWALEKSVAPKLNRNRLLSAKVGPNRDNFLSKCMRSLSRCFSEGGPPEVRVGLLRLLCTWMYGSADAYVGFQSSVMHLPLIVDLATKESTRGDTVEVHVRGLATILLAIGLTLDEAPQSLKQTLADVVQKRIGVSAFSVRLDDLLALPELSNVTADDPLALIPTSKLLAAESTKGSLSKKGGIGHDQYFDFDFTSLLREVYESSRSAVMQLMVDAEQNEPAVATGTASRAGDISASDEVVTQYKEIIRTQDISLAESREEIGLLKSSLNELQIDLDRSKSSGMDATGGENANVKAELIASKEEILRLEDTLKAKTEEMQSLAQAFAQLEQEMASSATEQNLEGSAAFDVVSGELKEELEAEKRKVFRLETQLMQSDLAEKNQLAELEVMKTERDDLLQRLSHSTANGGALLPTDLDALEEKRRREAAELKVKNLEEREVGLEATMSELQERVLSAEKVVVDAKAEASALSSKVKTLEHDLVTAKAFHRQEMDHKLDSQNQRESELAAEIERLSTRLHDSETRDTEREITSLKSSNTELQDEIVNLKAQIAGMQSEAEDLRERKRSIQLELDEVSSAHLQMKSQYETVNKEHGRESSENQRLSSLVRELQASEESARKMADAKDQELQAALRTNQTLEESLQEKESILVSVRQEAETASKGSEDLTEQIVRLSERLVTTEDSRQSFESELGEAKTEITRLQTQVKQMSSREERRTPKAAERKLSTSSIEVNDLQALLSETQNALQEAETDVERLQTECKSLKEQVPSLERKLSLAQKECMDLQRKLDDARSAHASQKEDLEAESATARRTLEENLADLRAELASLQGELGDERSKHYTQTMELEEKLASERDSVIHEREQRIELLEKECEALRLKVEGLEKSLADKTSEADNLKAELNTLQSQLHQESDRVRDLVVRFDANSSQIESDRATLESQLEEKTGRIDEVEKLLQELRIQRDDAVKENLDMESRNKELTAELSKAEEQLQLRTERFLYTERDLEEWMEKLVEEEEKRGELEKEKEDLEERVREISNDSESANSHMKEQIAHLTSDLDNIVRERDNLLQLNGQLESAIDLLRNESAKVEESKEELKASIEQIRNEHLSELRRRDENDEKLEAERSNLVETISDLNEKLSSASEQRETMSNAALEIETELKVSITELERRASALATSNEDLQAQVESVEALKEQALGEIESWRQAVIQSSQKLEEFLNSERPQVSTSSRDTESSTLFYLLEELIKWAERTRGAAEGLEHEKSQSVAAFESYRQVIIQSNEKIMNFLSTDTPDLQLGHSSTEESNLSTLVDIVLDKVEATQRAIKSLETEKAEILRGSVANEQRSAELLQKIEDERVVAEQNRTELEKKLSNVKEAHEKEIQDLEDRLSKALFDHADATEIIEEHEMKEHARIQAEAKLRKSLENLERKFVELEQLLQRRTAQLDETSSREILLSNEVSELKSNLEETQGEAQRTAQLLLERESEMVAAIAKTESDSKQKQDELMEALTRSNESLEKMEAEIKSLKHLHSEEKASVERTFSSAATKLKEQLEDKDSQHSRLVAGLEMELQAKDRAIARAQNGHQDDMEMKEREVSRLQVELDDVESRLESMTTRVRDQSAKLEESKSTEQSYLEELQTLKSENAELGSRIERQSVELCSSEKKLEETLLAHETAASAAQQSLALAEEEAESLRKEIVALVEELGKQEESAALELEGVSQSLQTAEGSLSQVQEELRELQAYHEETVRMKSEEISSLKQSLEENVEQTRRLETQFRESESSLQTQHEIELQNQLAEKEEEVAELRRSFAQEKDAYILEAAESELNKLDRQKAELEEKWNEQLADLVSIHRSEIASMIDGQKANESEILSMRSAHDVEKQELNRIKTELETRQEDILRVKTQLEEDLKSQVEKLADKEDLLRRNREMLEEKEKKQIQLLSTVEEMKLQVEEANSNLEWEKQARAEEKRLLEQDKEDLSRLLRDAKERQMETEREHSLALEEHQQIHIRVEEQRREIVQLKQESAMSELASQRNHESGLASLQRAEEALAAALAEKARLVQELNGTQQLLDERKMTIDTLELRMRELEESNRASAENVDSETAEQVERLRSEVLRLENEAKLMAAEKASLEMNMSSYKEQVEDKRKLLSIAEEAQRDLRERLVMLRGQRDRTGGSDSGLESVEIAQLRKQLEDVVEERDQLRTDLSSFEDMKDFDSPMNQEMVEVTERLAREFPTLERMNVDSFNCLSALERVHTEIRLLRGEMQRNPARRLAEKERRALRRPSSFDTGENRQDSYSTDVHTTSPASSEVHEDHLSSLRVQVSAEQANNRSLLDRVRSLEKELRDRFLELSQTKSQLDDHVKRLNEAESRNATLEDQISILSQDSETLQSVRSELEDAQLIMEQLELEVGSLTKSNVDLEEQLHVGQRELEGVRGDLNSKTVALRDLEQKRAKETEDFEKRYAELKTSLVKQQEHSRTTELDFRRKLEGAKQELSEVRTRLSASVKSLEEEVRVGKANVERIRKTRDVLESEVGRLRMQLEQQASKKSVESLEQEVSELLIEKSELTERVNWLERELGDSHHTKDQLVSCQAEKSSFESQWKEAAKHIELLEHSNRRLEQEVSDIERRRAFMEAEVEELHEKLTEADHEVSQALDVRLGLEERIEQMKRSDRSHKVEQLERKIDDLLVQAAQARSDAAEVTASKAELEEKLRQLQRRSNSHESVSTLVQRIKRLEANIKEKDAVLSTHEALQRELQDLENRLKTTYDQLLEAEERNKELEQRLDLAAREMSDMSEMQFGSPQSRNVSTELLEKESQIVSLEQERDEILRSKAELEDRLNRMNRESIRGRSSIGGESSSGGVGPNGLAWEAEYNKLLEEHDEVLQCLAEMELGNN